MVCRGYTDEGAAAAGGAAGAGAALGSGAAATGGAGGAGATLGSGTAATGGVTGTGAVVGCGAGATVAAGLGAAFEVRGGFGAAVLFGMSVAWGFGVAAAFDVCVGCGDEGLHLACFGWLWQEFDFAAALAAEVAVAVMAIAPPIARIRPRIRKWFKYFIEIDIKSVGDMVVCGARVNGF